MGAGVAASELASVCRGCHGGCSALVRVEGGRVVRVRPAPGSRFNLGQMCPKGLAAAEIMYHPSGLLTPLKRDGERAVVEWNTALAGREPIKAYHVMAGKRVLVTLPFRR